MAGYAPNDFVPSGWRRTSGDAAAVPTVELWGDDGEKSLVQCVDRNKPIYLFWEPDILISADEGEKETLLKKDFHVVSLSITIHPVPKEATDADNNPATRTRARNAALETDPKDPTVVNRILVADPKPTRPWTELNFTRLTPEALTEWRPNRGGGKSEAGLWEARITAEIMGRLSDKAEYETKTLEGAIRFAVVEPGEFNLRILNADGVRKPEAGPKKP
jgi:hypothetical protein